jgi:hypothetical protein
MHISVDPDDPLFEHELLAGMSAAEGEEDAKQCAALLERYVPTLLQSDASLLGREAGNTRFLLELMRAPLPACLDATPSFRRVGCRLEEPDAPPPDPQASRDIGHIVHRWMVSPSNTGALTALREGFSAWCVDSGPQAPFAVCSKSPHPALFRSVLQAYQATHLLFMLTDWLVCPCRAWDVQTHGIRHEEVKNVLTWIEAAWQTVAPHRDVNAEIYMELSGCVGVLLHQPKALADAQALVRDDNWPKRVQWEQDWTVKRRHKNDISLHCALLRAWTLQLR